MTAIKNNPRLEVADDALWCDNCDEVIDEGEEFYAGNLNNLCATCEPKPKKMSGPERARSRVLKDMYVYLYDGETGPDHEDTTRWSNELFDMVLAGLSIDEFAALKAGPA